MATPNYAYEKRQKELAKKQKQLQKQQQKLAAQNKGQRSAEDVSPDSSPGNGNDASSASSDTQA